MRFINFLNNDYSISEDDSSAGCDPDIPKIYVDMDGVLVDFIKGWNKEVSPMSPEKFMDKHGKQAFYDEAKKLDVNFWANLDWMKDGKKLWSYIKKHNPTICSTAMSSKENHSLRGKAIWLKQNVNLFDKPVTRPTEFTGSERIIISDKKELYIKTNPLKNSILIDDREKVLKPWIDRGGTGILHKNTANTIKELKKLGL